VDVPSRTVVLMDATGSMTALLMKSKTAVRLMFERASTILKQNGIKEDNFQLQFAVYRNYNSTADRILQFSGWYTNPDNLRQFMENISVEGGWGNEAIEVGFWHVNHETSNGASITQVILIGDAPANTQKEIQSKRGKQHGESYWSTSKFGSGPKHYSEELKPIIANHIPVHCFWVHDLAKSNFMEIAQLTKGHSAALDIDTEAGAEMLTGFVTQSVLQDVGGDKGKKLVDDYVAKYGGRSILGE